MWYVHTTTTKSLNHWLDHWLNHTTMDMWKKVNTSFGIGADEIRSCACFAKKQRSTKFVKSCEHKRVKKACASTIVSTKEMEKACVAKSAEKPRPARLKNCGADVNKNAAPTHNVRVTNSFDQLI